MAAPVFHMEFGINDTALTNVLTIGDFKTAERIIKDNNEPGYLNEGPYDKIPLALVISNEEALRTCPRNLKLAKLLVERGANPNQRFPEAGFRRASASPLEELVAYYLMVKRKIRKGAGTHFTSEAVGLNGERSLSYETLAEQLLDLLDAFFAGGADPNIRTIHRGTLLHAAASEDKPDLHLIKRLCDAGANINLGDAHGSTPLMDFILSCSIEDALQVYWYFICENKELDMSSQNCMGETVLWRAIFSGGTELALNLLYQGADIRTQASLDESPWKVPYDSDSDITFLSIVSGLSLAVSTLLAPLVEDSGPYSIYSHVYPCNTRQQKPRASFHVSLADKIIDSSISPIVDNLVEIDESVLTNSPVSRLGSFESFVTENASNNLARSMFGKLTAGLQQLCVRTIVNHVVFRSDADMKTLRELFDESDEEFHIPISQAQRAHKLSPLFMDNLRVRLGLPPSLLHHFNVEGARCKIAVLLNSLESSACSQDCEDDSDDIDSLDALSSSSGDSDMESSFDDSLPSSGRLTDSSYETVSMRSDSTTSLSEDSDCDIRSTSNKSGVESDGWNNCCSSGASDLDNQTKDLHDSSKVVDNVNERVDSSKNDADNSSKSEESDGVCDNGDESPAQEVKPNCKLKYYTRFEDDV